MTRAVLLVDMQVQVEGKRIVKRLCRGSVGYVTYEEGGMLFQSPIKRVFNIPVTEREVSIA